MSVCKVMTKFDQTR